jgi:acetoacetate decarboxylase
MGRLLTPDRLAQDPDGAILEDVTIKGASTSLTALSLTPHALAPVAELPVLEIVSSVHMICDLTLGLGKVVHDYLH